MRKPSPWDLWTLSFELCIGVMAEVEPAVRTHGLEMKEFFLLAKLDDHPYPGDLARVLVTPKPTVTFMVKRMEAAGFVQRETETGDLRKFRLSLTKPGRKAMEAACAILEAAYGKRIGRLSARERAVLGGMLERMASP